MKVFVAYRFTGADLSALGDLLGSVQETLKEKGLNSYCSFFDQEKFAHELLGPKEIMDEAFKELDSCDYLLVLLMDSAKSEGVLMEAGYAIAKGIPLIVAAHRDTLETTYLPKMTPQTVLWSEKSELLAGIAALNLDK